MPLAFFHKSPFTHFYVFAVERLLTLCVFVWKHYAMNALEKFRKENKLTYEAVGEKPGYRRGTVYKHCQADIIPGEAAIKYHRAFGIPLSDLRPDLYPDKSQEIHPQDAA
ncbi:MAG: helix-turn-helix domain-containing protein [Pseudodesulfovibrio sp.]|uniref:helix-turn-helix domain-containing protein n=1 Tax=Pseudodesulfovibrio sp. TaxID=2035812 RepID=UPI003D0A350A